MASSMLSVAKPNLVKSLLHRSKSSSGERVIPSLLQAFFNELATFALKSASVMILPRKRSTST